MIRYADILRKHLQQRVGEAQKRGEPGDLPMMQATGQTIERLRPGVQGSEELARSAMQIKEPPSREFWDKRFAKRKAADELRTATQRGVGGIPSGMVEADFIPIPEGASPEVKARIQATNRGRREYGWKASIDEGYTVSGELRRAVEEERRFRRGATEKRGFAQFEADLKRDLTIEEVQQKRDEALGKVSGFPTDFLQDPGARSDATRLQQQVSEGKMDPIKASELLNQMAESEAAGKVRPETEEERAIQKEKATAEEKRVKREETVEEKETARNEKRINIRKTASERKLKTQTAELANLRKKYDTVEDKINEIKDANEAKEPEGKGVKARLSDEELMKTNPTYRRLHKKWKDLDAKIKELEGTPSVGPVPGKAGLVSEAEVELKAYEDELANLGLKPSAGTTPPVSPSKEGETVSYEDIPSGEIYIAPDGTKRRKR